MIVFGLISKAIFAVGFVIALFVVGWYFYIHDHAARTTGGIETSLSRELDKDAHCQDTGRGWRCTAGGRTYAILPRGKKNCWRANGRDVEGCVKVIDYVRGLA
ncbi:MAG: hypothetical protein ACJ762_01355 [Solirubrobacteraceae bacterium]